MQIINKNYEDISVKNINKDILEEILLFHKKQKLIKNNNLSTNLIFSRLLRSIEISPHTVIRRIRLGNGISFNAALAIYTNICKLFLIIYHDTNDVRYINSLLKLNDSLYRNFGLSHLISIIFYTQSKKYKYFLRELNKCIFTVNSENVHAKALITPIFLSYEQIQKFVYEVNESKYSGGVALFCPNVRSLYTLCVAEMLRKSGVKVEAVFVKKIFNYSRIMYELRRDGLHWVFKKFVFRYLLRGYSERKVLDHSLAHLSRLLNVEKLNLASWASKHNVKVINTNDFNSGEIQSYIGRHSIELGVFTGGGLIRKNILEEFKRGIINCHGGLLPAYRGLDVEKWAILENNAGALGCCAHMMTEAVDEGAVVAQYLFKLKKPTTVEKIGLGYEYPQAILLTHAALELLGDRVKPIAQHKHDGRQFFYMHDSLVNIVKCRLSIA